MHYLNKNHMRNKIFFKWTFGVAIAALPFAGGCLQENPSPTVQSAAAITPVAGPAVYQAAESQPVELASAAPATAAEEKTAPTLPALTQAAVQPISTNQPPPPKVRLTTGAAELVRMANSG